MLGPFLKQLQCLFSLPAGYYILLFLVVKNAPEDSFPNKSQSFHCMDRKNGTSSPSSASGLNIAALLFCREEEPGTYRMYIQGRPISFRLPEGYEQPVKPDPAAAPEKKLQLDWVYPFLHCTSFLWCCLLAAAMCECSVSNVVGGWGWPEQVPWYWSWPDVVMLFV